MDKFESPCGYIYDPDEGDPAMGLSPEHLLKICRMIGSAPNVPLKKNILKKSNGKKEIRSNNILFFPDGKNFDRILRIRPNNT